MKSRKPIASSRFIWLKVFVLALGFAGVVRLMQWLQKPDQEIGLTPIPAKVQFSGAGHETTPPPSN